MTASCLGLVALAAVVIFCASASPAAEPTKILLIGHNRDGHDYETHMYMAECRLLAHCLRQTPGVEPVVSNRWPEDDAVSDGIAAIALYVPVGANVLFNGPQRDRVKKLLSSGVGLSAIHWSTGADGDELGHLWLDSLGAWFSRDFSPIEHVEKRVVQRQPEHPVARGWRDFTMHDEYYWDLRFAPGAQPLMVAERDGKQQTIGWTFERAAHRDGRSFGTVAGHYHRSFADRSFRQAVVNGILWTARVEIPNDGAPCEVSEEDLRLPGKEVLD